MSSSEETALSKNNFFKLKLFWKIIIWFWLSTVAIIIINLYIVSLNSDKNHFLPLHKDARNELIATKKKLTHLLNRQNKHTRTFRKRINNR